VVKLPEGYNPAANDTSVAAGVTRAINAVRDAAAGLLSVPLMGKIAAGTPIEAIRDEGSFVDIPAGMVGRAIP
jgi:repressor LexA